ncbi:MAG: molybdopterin-binding protein [Pseudomonadota bacterium]
MTFGEVPLAEALGATLAHSVKLDGGVLKKGIVLAAADVAALRAAGQQTVVVARLDAGDLDEDTAALRIGAALANDNLRLGPAFTGRVNLIAERAGVLRVSTRQVHALNQINEGLTLATLPDLMRVAPDQLVATVKIIPYGAPQDVIAAGVATLEGTALEVNPFHGGKARLVMTRTPGFKESLLEKGEAVVRARLKALNFMLDDVSIVPHETGAVASALRPGSDVTLILGASATSDRLDVAPAAVVAAGGQIGRFGMPVDPGNLLFLGTLAGAPVVGLPGCARSPALNGVDWVLERLAAGIPVSPDDVAAMGVGGLLKEMPGRPQPRRPRS